MPKLLRALIVEDSEDDVFFTVQELARGGFDPEFERVETLAGVESALDRQAWDVIISDHSLPGFTSLQALELIKRRQYDIPFIIVSGVIGEETAVKAMKAGANDYVMKSALARLVPSIERELVEASNRRIRRQAEKALRRSQYDLNDFFENAPISLHWATPDGTILRVNSAELKMLGCTPQECLGHSVAEFFVDSSVAADVLQQLRGGESFTDYETRLRCKDGTVKDVLINTNTLWDDGKFIRSRWFTSDLTHRKEEEQERLSLIRELSEALASVKTLRGLLPICASCKKIRDDGGYWNKLESYLAEHTQVQFTHGICPDCGARFKAELNAQPAVKT
jgi:PAS domain S-box-containing protein